MPNDADSDFGPISQARHWRSPASHLPITSTSWRFARQGGPILAERMRFIPGGRIVGSTHPNEAIWRIEDDKLILLSADSRVSTTFDVPKAVAGTTMLTGIFNADPVIRHTLEPNLDDLRTIQCLVDPRDPVLIIFNSAGNTFGSGRTPWEFFRDTQDNDFNYIRFAERGDPPCWYLNKYSRITLAIDRIIQDGHRELGLYGISSGGFAAMLYGELIAAEHPECSVRTLSINPQTVHGEQHEAAARSVADHAKGLPLFIEPDALRQLDAPVGDIPSAADHRQHDNIRHRVIYDGGNPLEEMYASFIRDRPGFQLFPLDLNRGHAEGIRMIRGSWEHEAAYSWVRFAGP